MPIISLFTLVLVVALAAVVGYLAYLYDSPNPDFEINTRVIDILTFAPSAASRLGILWLFVQGVIFLKR